METQEATTLGDVKTISNPKIWGHACGGQELRAVLLACSKWLSEHTEVINALNVFPVPDGDTGTNMSRTMEAAVAELPKLDKATADQVSASFARQALMGARGNSGVILSQIIRGLSEGLHGKETFTAADLTNALVRAKELAYKATMKPTEGTILTVVREAADAAVEAAKKHNNFLYVLMKTVAAARESVARTPQLLETLREAGVVDAGGHGFYVILEGALRYLRGESLVKTELAEVEKARPQLDTEQEGHQTDEYGYCTNFMVFAKDGNIPFEKARETIAAMGTSAVIIGDGEMLKVHIHTENPGQVFSYAVTLGSLDQIKVDNMQLQYERAHKNPESASSQSDEISSEPKEIAIVSVVSGDGLRQHFKGLGADLVVNGGQTMNPSTQDLLKAVEKLPAQSVIILPNNKNIVMAANQVQALTNKKVVVVPTATIPQGITALTRFNFEANLDENSQQMTATLKDVVTGELTKAVRDVTINGLSVKDGQWIGLVDDVLKIASSDKEDAIWQLLEQMRAGEHELLTFFYGEDVTEAEAQDLQAKVKGHYPDCEVEFAHGGQPHYHYIVSAE